MPTNQIAGAIHATEILDSGHIWTLGGNGFIFASGIPEAIVGDVNGDGDINLLDIQPFVELLANGQFIHAADANFDGTVDFSDFLAQSANFGQSERTWSQGDADCNGAVQFADFLLLSANFGQTVGATAASVPEPQGMVQVLLFAAMICVTARKRRRVRVG